MAYDSDDIDDEAPAETKGDKDDAVRDRAVLLFDEITTAVQEERAEALQDRRFVSIAGAQWEGLWGDQFANSIMVEVNKTAMGVEKIIADYRENRITVNFRGIDKGADEDTAETLDGMLRADVYASKGQQAFDNAFEEAVQGGYGAFRVVNEYEDEYDPENDAQRIAVKAIVDADQSVFWDPNAKLYDKSDAKFCYVITAMAKSAFEREYPKADNTDWPDATFKTYYDWYTPEVVRVCEFYEVEEKEGLLRIFRHVASDEERREWASDLTREQAADMRTEGWRQVRTRRAKRKIIVKYTFTGAEVLEGRKVVAGTCIPVVPVYGKRWFIDNMERARGHVRLAKDPQRIYNAQISKLSETAAAAPIERPIFTPEQVQGHEQSWAEANLNRSPYALVNPITDENGQVVATGPIATINPPQMSPVLAGLIQITANDIAELTSAEDGADQVRSNVSAEAMDIAATRTDAKTGIYMDNMRQSMQRFGEIYLGMAPDVYVEEGREVETMGENAEQGTATLAERFTDDKGRHRIRNDISRGRYRVISDVTEATATKRDKTVKRLTGVAQVVAPFDPESANAMMNTAVLNMDGDGMSDLQEWLRARGVAAGYVKPTEEEKAQMDEAAAQAEQPDPQSQFLIAAAAEKQASAQQKVALTAKAEADTDKSLADAEKTRMETREGVAERRVGVLDRVKGLFAPKPAQGRQ